ncbi:hypothetical protein BS50DRAFT_361001 [Corynespora cassiicola Philippines]|uniref:Uncharacterized protein n=1 Tax=Corynespora cassiicola Philippines TaxID=1448308 RepID=A0A2T2NS98_CORCC|nr:hypothetical protein BS50DRAFT_361001 [Corynespora cassiicola Philippines]
MNGYGKCSAESIRAFLNTGAIPHTLVPASSPRLHRQRNGVIVRGAWSCAFVRPAGTPRRALCLETRRVTCGVRGAFRSRRKSSEGSAHSRVEWIKPTYLSSTSALSSQQLDFDTLD